MTEAPTPTTVESIRKALLAYRVMAWTTGVWLIALCYEIYIRYVVKVDDPPTWIGVVLYRFETNIRVPTVLGMVGAGGIGFELISSMKLFAYEDTAACVIVILVLVLVADLLSSKLRAMIR